MYPTNGHSNAHPLVVPHHVPCNIYLFISCAFAFKSSLFAAAGISVHRQLLAFDFPATWGHQNKEAPLTIWNLRSLAFVRIDGALDVFLVHWMVGGVRVSGLFGHLVEDVG